MQAELSSGGRRPRELGRLPNLVIAGVSKAGTTSLFNYLGQHPEIGLSDVKEVRYFSPLRYGEPLAPVETYMRHFAGCMDTRYATEATPGYLYGGAALAQGLRRTCPEARVLLSLRAPANRCWSWFSFVKSRVRIPKTMSFEEYLDRCEELHRLGVDGRIENQPFWGLGGGCYSTWMDAWIDEFGDRLKVVFFEDLKENPRAVVASVCEWLELDRAPVSAFTFPVENRTAQYRSRTLQEAAVFVNARSEKFFRRHPDAKRLLRSSYHAVNRDRGEPRMSPEAMVRLDSFYGPFTARLEAQLADLGLSLPSSWLSSSQS